MKYSNILLLSAMLAGGTLSAETMEINARLFGHQKIEYKQEKNGVTVTIFNTESPEKASLTASKRKSDLLNFGDLKLLPGQNGLPDVIVMQDSGYWLSGVRGNQFIEIFGRDRAEIEKIAKHQYGGLRNVKPNTHPRILDGFDRDGLAYWVGAGGSNYKLPIDFEWMQKHKFAFCTLYPNQDFLKEPGVADMSIYNWHEAMAKKYDLGYRILIFPSEWPNYWNREPLPYVKSADGFKAIPGISLYQMATSGGEEPNRVGDMLREEVMHSIGARIGKSKHFLGWHGSTEIPTISIVQLGAYSNTPEIIELYHKYLQKELSMTLADVGRVYYGNENKFKSWDEVKIPLPADFLHFDSPETIDLTGTWEYRFDQDGKGIKEKWYDSKTAPKDWTPTAGNNAMLDIFHTRGNRGNQVIDSWMRRSFTIPANPQPSFFAKLFGAKAKPFDPNKHKYLHISRAEYHGSRTDPFRVFVNGIECKNLFPHQGSFGEFSMCYDIGPAIKEGKNDIVLETFCNAIPGYIFINDYKMTKYPYMDKQHNQMWYDGINFCAYVRTTKLEKTLRAIRSVDPVRPIKLMATGKILDLTNDLCDRYGAYMHDTGAAGGFWCPMTGASLSKAHGRAWSCEQGGPPRDMKGYRTAISRYLMYGNDALDNVFACSNYHGLPDVSKWIDEHEKLLHCIGQTSPRPIELGVLRTFRTDRLGYSTGWNWDHGRHRIRGAGRESGYVENTDLVRKDYIKKFKVIFDSATLIMTPKDVKAIREYVEQGGTFIANFYSGLHSPAEAESNPLLKEFGLTQKNRTVSHDKNVHSWRMEPLTFEKDENFLPSQKGQSLNASGYSVEYLDMKGPHKYKMIPIARWTKDGSIAICELKVGKGRFIYNGATVFERAINKKHSWEVMAYNFDECLTNLGFPRNAFDKKGAMTDSRESKNGVYDLYLVCRTSWNKPEQMKIAPQFVRKTPVSKILEIGDNALPYLPVEWKDGKFRAPEKEYEFGETHIFALPAEDLGRSAMRWIRNQAGIWHAVEQVPQYTASAAKIPNDIIMLNDIWVLKEGDDPKWINTLNRFGIALHMLKRVTPGSFATMGYPEDAKLLLRKEVKIPDHWYGKKITLNFECAYWFWGIMPYARIWINGSPAPIAQPIVPRPDGGFSIDVTNQARGGKILIVIAIDGTKARQPQIKPNGILGLMSLRAEKYPDWTKTISGPWYACKAYGERQAVKEGQKVQCRFFETQFTIPETMKDKEVHLTFDAPVSGIILNGHSIRFPASMRHLNITNMVNKTGTNFLNCVVGQEFHALGVRTGILPHFQLSFYDK